MIFVILELERQIYYNIIGMREGVGSVITMARKERDIRDIRELRERERGMYYKYVS